MTFLCLYLSIAVTVYSGVVVWKSQSPWPSLRGQLYDSSLEQSGGFWGILRATSNNLRESDLAALTEYLESNHDRSKSGAGDGAPTARGAEGGGTAAEGAQKMKREGEERRGALYGGSVLKKGPPLHVQINPITLSCAVINRGRFDYSWPHKTSVDAEEVTSVFTVRAVFRTLYGIQVRA